MFPILLEIGPVRIYSYSVLIIVGALSGLLWTIYEAKKSNVNVDTILHLVFYLVIGGLVGARLMSVVIDWDNYQNDVMNIFKIWQGGLVFYGGLIGSLFAGFIMLKRQDQNILKIADLIAPGLALSQSIGRIGCFAAGCCYGKPTHVPWAVSFVHAYSAAPHHQQLHPTQLYSAITLFCLFLFLAWLRKRDTILGWCFFSYLLLHGTFRFIIEFFRDDYLGPGLFGSISSTQAVAVMIIVFSSLMLVYLSRKSGMKRGHLISD